MKKIIFGLVVFLFASVMVGCDKTTNEMDYQQVLIDASSTLTIESETSTSIELPQSLDHEDLLIDITWSSDNSALLNHLGVVNRPSFDEGDQTVRLTALLSYDIYLFSKVFDVKVLKMAEEMHLTVSFESDSDNIIEPLMMYYNDLIINPPIAMKAGYTFVGWTLNLDTNALFDFDTPITDNMTLYAIYDVNTYEILFETNGGDFLEPMGGEYLSAITEPAIPTKAYHTFEGWYEDDSFNKPFSFDQMPLGGIKLYAKWLVNEYELSFDSNGGSPVDTITRAYNSVISMPKAPIKAGFELEGWYLDSNFNTSFDFLAMPAGDIQVYAKWQAEEIDPLSYIDIFYLNDLHGSIERKDQELGLAYIANYVNFNRSLNPNGTILLAGGDMFQGSALSNYYQGLSTLTMMNHMGFDAMTLGNHEFDWGLEAVTNYFDGSYLNHEATFPLLGANVFYKGTKSIVDHIEPYTIIDRENVKIGIIGTMGYGLEESIAQSRIDDYVFANPTDYIQTYATYLRQEKDVDYVIVVSHDPGDINSAVSSLTGDASVDLIFNAHSHSAYTRQLNQTEIIQSGSNGRYVGKISINLTTDEITTTNVSSHPALNEADKKIQSIIDLYKAKTDTLFNTEIIRSGRYASADQLSNWLTDLILVKTNVDIAFHNYGGTRTYLSNGESITLGKLYQIFPFDNIIKTVELDGSTINSFIKRSNAYSTTVSEFQTGTKYLVATNDYLFDKTDNPFIYGDNPNYDGTLLRDMVEAELKLQALVYNNFTVDNPLLTNAVTQTSTYQAIINFYN